MWRRPYVERKAALRKTCKARSRHSVRGARRESWRQTKRWGRGHESEMRINPMQRGHTVPPGCKVKSKRTRKPCRAPAWRAIRDSTDLVDGTEQQICRERDYIIKTTPHRCNKRSPDFYERPLLTSGGTSRIPKAKRSWRSRSRQLGFTNGPVRNWMLASSRPSNTTPNSNKFARNKIG